MRLKPTPTKTSGASRQGGFTLAEVLAALLFMAIVIPTAVHGLRVASLAADALLDAYRVRPLDDSERRWISNA